MEIFENVANLVASKLKAGTIVETKGYHTAGDGGGAKYLIQTSGDYGSTPDGYGDHALANTNVAVLQHSGEVNVLWFGAVDGQDNRLAYQSAISAADVIYSTIASVSNQPTLVDKDCQIRGGSFDWVSGNNVFEVTGTRNGVKFTGVEFTSTQPAFTSQGAIGCQSGTVTSNWTVEDCVFDGVPFGVYINADSSGSHKNPKVIRCTFKNAPRFVNDSASGAGLGLVFASGGGVIENGLSQENVFDSCQRHSLYISNGGDVTSRNDSFSNHRVSDGGTYATELAALQIARSSNDTIVDSPRFYNCFDTCITVTPVLTNAATTDAKNVVIKSPMFVNNNASCIRISSDSPAVNGVLSNCIIDSPLISGGGAVSPINVLSGVGVVIRCVTVTAGAATYNELIRVFGHGTTSEFDNLIIDRVVGDLPAGADGIRIDSRVCTGSARVRLTNLDANMTTVYAAAVTNPEIVEDAPILEEHPMTTVADPNGVVTARPATIFLSRSGGTGATLWVKETTFGNSGWVAK